ncbi:HotDog domain-containing protein [Hypoxylon trugodes]|uniref:HotDog domain-containing protein n=1 Tax=Hypoxylon trugodes TaxID=326681 RepID=UPI002191AF02|nr:HotDog domain-containing protein [Hypoxylon trugodes]KAI1389144.1 HotDog domain-containing protein [Hypoxylon trugodes]
MSASSQKDAKTPIINLMKALKPFKGIERVEAFLKLASESYQDPQNHEWMTTITPHLKIHSHSPSPPTPSVTFLLTVLPIHANGLNNMHGGCTSTIFDSCTSLALHLIAKPGFWEHMGVSRSLNVTYLRPIPVGTTITIKCEVLAAGRNQSALRGEMRAVGEDGREGPLLAVCDHGKVNTDPPVEKL